MTYTIEERITVVRIRIEKIVERTGSKLKDKYWKVFIDQGRIGFSFDESKKNKVWKQIRKEVKL